MVANMVTTETSGLKRFFLFFISQCRFYSVKSLSFVLSCIQMELTAPYRRALRRKMMGGKPSTKSQLGDNTRLFKI